MNKPKIHSRFDHFERDCNNCRQGDADLLRTHKLSTPVPPDCLQPMIQIGRQIFQRKYLAARIPILNVPTCCFPRGNLFLLVFYSGVF